MHQNYPDIIAAVTDGLRFRHLRVADVKPSPYPECQAPQVGHCSCVASPLWWDENGVPRWGAHHPNLCPDIYADEVALVEIACQNCGAVFHVQMSRSSSSGLMDTARAINLVEALTGIEVSIPSASSSVIGDMRAKGSLASAIESGRIHYGDPPNDGCCPAGPTMNCDDLRVLEYWYRDTETSWTRVPQLEIDLPDARDPQSGGAR